MAIDNLCEGPEGSKKKDSGTYRSESEYLEESALRAINKPRIVNPDKDGFYNSEDEFFDEKCTP